MPPQKCLGARGLVVFGCVGGCGAFGGIDDIGSIGSGLGVAVGINSPRIPAPNSLSHPQLSITRGC